MWSLSDTGEVLNDPHLHAREMIVEVEHPMRGHYLTAGIDQAVGYRCEIGTAPLLGQHNGEVLQELGYDAGDIARLREEGAI
jgi:formyl-CoA transferase